MTDASAAWICVWVGYTLSACFVCLTGRIGATHHIGFPIVNRASFGIWGSLWPVLNRAVMACVWYGVQAWIGGECVYLMIASIWPSFGQRLTLAASIAMGGTVDYLISFILFWLGSLPFIWFPVHKIRHLFTVKGNCCTHCGYRSLSLGHRSRGGRWSYHSSTSDCGRISVGMGRDRWYHVCCVELRNTDRQRSRFCSLCVETQRCFMATANHNTYGLWPNTIHRYHRGIVVSCNLPQKGSNLESAGAPRRLYHKW